MRNEHSLPEQEIKERENRSAQQRMEHAGRFLPGIHAGLPEPFFHLAEVLEQEAFELCRDNRTGEYRIPYMMNDALEYYFILKEAVVTGQYLPEEPVTAARLAEENGRYLLILRQESGNTATLIFRRLEEHARCYQYHQIGHFWVEGQEQWRQLVYMIGTIHDKYEFFGDRFCSEAEKALIPLMHFAPFRKWSPIHESLEELYPEDTEGIRTMEALAGEAGDRGYQRLVRWYGKFPGQIQAWFLGRRLLSGRRQNLYQLLWEKVEQASGAYPQRDYGPVGNEEIDRLRKKVEHQLQTEGFCGQYPDFWKAEGNFLIQITAAEEHPFTVMEQDDFRFRIQLMWSESRRPGRNDGQEKVPGKNVGFFHGRGNRGRIVPFTERIDEKKAP